MLTSHTLNSLRKLSEPVHGGAAGETRLPARVVAQCLSGVVRLITNHVGHDEMRRVCAELALNEQAWATALRSLPGQSPATLYLVSSLEGMRSLASEHDLRAALAFWAVESDPAEWQRLAA